MPVFGTLSYDGRCCDMPDDALSHDVRLLELLPYYAGLWYMRRLFGVGHFEGSVPTCSRQGAGRNADCGGQEETGQRAEQSRAASR